MLDFSSAQKVLECAIFLKHLNFQLFQNNSLISPPPKQNFTSFIKFSLVIKTVFNTQNDYYKPTEIQHKFQIKKFNDFFRKLEKN